MGNIAYRKLLEELPGKKVERPNRATSGTLSGHAAGEPFEKLVYGMLKGEYPDNVYKQFEYLNELYRKNSKMVTAQDRYDLVQSLTAAYLLNRGYKPTENWTPESPFEEKQSDTADILYHRPGYYELIDVKTHNKHKRSQPPNIISSYKLAMMCKYMIDNEEYGTVGLKYIGVEWEEAGDELACTNTHYADMFKATPSTLYINWAAGLQIQQHVADFDQSWQGGVDEWVVAYLKTFVHSARNRIKVMDDNYVKPFLPYIS